MKTSYYLVTAAGLAAAAVIVYPQLRERPGTAAVPDRPLAADPTPPPATPAEIALPPIPIPVDRPLVIPASAELPALPTPPVPTAPAVPVPEVPADPLPVPPNIPSVPLPELTPPAVPPVAPEAGPAVPPVSPPPAKSDAAPAVPPVIPPLPVPVDPTPKPDGTPVAPPPAAVLPKPAPLPVPAESVLENPRPLLDGSTPNTTGKYVVLKGNRLVEASVALDGQKAVIRQGALDRTVPKDDVLYVAESKDEVRRFMLAKVQGTDPAARLGVARWLMFAGLREEALGEAREVLKLQPRSTAAADMVRSLEESLKAFPGDGTTQVVAAKPAATLTTAEPEPDVTAEGATTFSARAQPVLANQCMDCHARADHPGAFKLVRVTGFEVGPHSTRSNLRATAAQLKKDDPLNSPLLTKALAAHGGMKQPAFVSRNAPAFRALEAWVLLAANAPAPTMTPPTPPATQSPAVVPTVPPMTPPVDPVLPPVETVPAVPPAVPPTVPPPPPAVPVPPPPVPAVPPVLPTPPSIPPADTSPKTAAPVIPPIPPAAALPTLPGGVQPAGGTGQFGTTAPPKPVPTAPATGGDEFDPAAFNKGK